MRLAVPLVLVLAAAPLGGCGGSGSGPVDSSTAATPRHGASTAPASASLHSCRSGEAGVSGLRAAGTTCTEARHLMLGWTHSSACRPPAGASRASCPALSYRCIATATDRGWSVSCWKPGRAIGFTARRG
jgi:hypothetical protein